MNLPAPQKFKYEVYSEDGLFIARCLDLDIASDGSTEEEALANLREAIELYIQRSTEERLNNFQVED